MRIRLECTDVIDGNSTTRVVEVEQEHMAYDRVRNFAEALLTALLSDHPDLMGMREPPPALDPAPVPLSDDPDRGVPVS